MKKYLLTICVLLIVVACTGQQKSSGLKMAGIDIPLDQMNKEIRLEPTLGMIDTFKFAGVLELNLDNLSNNPVTLPPDFGVKIFMKQDATWIPIKNTFGYSNSANVLPPKKDYSWGDTVGVMPLMPSPPISTTIRIIVLGNIEGTGQAVGAYIDIDLNQ